MIKLLSIFIFIISLSACSSMSEKDCLAANWYQLGMNDAKAGKAKSTLGDYKDSCMRHGVKFDSEEYIQGYEKGSK